ncbi:hypothetical protein A3D03_00060 [Candidatus Gottesmanbacteria bacterium RIFCSPHIGHO2_02_FULL_40_13]|uniref:Glycosyltransferase 2-like domain-containing protein n=1 Tax=Candidatus Gottesmanbacteria bacterium RIFCSPHIGHO2_02_FULL_40_13 TaxID=1798384 RepID=A0A1F6A7H4_9BACT|nr:MAG: hypothetical protein A3D03_00060 [Candidatus Gottesmanbacteria bacterium RIFCSPHIGHO2_02_FULL_40_13]
MKLSIIIPVYNEEKTIHQVLISVASLKLPCTKEIIVVDDGSTDNTRKHITNSREQNEKLKNIKVITHKKNLGKGTAIRTGIKRATGDYILIQDADLEYNSQEIPKLLSPVISYSKNYNLKPKTFISVYGSRFANGRPVIPLLYYLGNRLLTILFNLFYGTNLTDMETGYKLIPTKLLKSLKFTSSGFDIEPEITALLVKQGVFIIEVPISYKGRSHLAGKKLTVKDAFGAIVTIIKNKFRS